MKSVFPTGTTIHMPDRCQAGYTLISDAGQTNLIDMDGRIVHQWQFGDAETMGFIHRARLMPDGRLIILVGETADTPGHVRQYDWNGAMLWDYTPEDGNPHHDFWPTPDGGVMLICKAPVPAQVSGKIADPARRELTIYDDTIIEVSHDKRVVWRWRQHEHLDINVCNPHPADRDWEGGPDNNTVTDWTHTNTVQALPENRWFDAGDERFRPGNVMITMRQLDTILVIDRKTGQAVWSYTGDFHGGLSGPHEGGMIPKPLPGAGNILVFDNGSLPYRDLAHAGKSYVLEIDPPAKKVVWVYKDGLRFFSPFTSNCQRLANGNTLILEASCRRVFEVTPDGEIVWEHIPTENARRIYRYPHDHCPQTASIGDSPSKV